MRVPGTYFSSLLPAPRGMALLTRVYQAISSILLPYTSLAGHLAASTMPQELLVPWLFLSLLT